eukprot:scaffold434391_cov20-Prasinocladus_malaysianus.AAC.2
MAKANKQSFHTAGVSGKPSTAEVQRYGATPTMWIILPDNKLPRPQPFAQCMCHNCTDCFM